MWTISLSPGFIGQGIITGPIIPLHMLAGVIVGWAILSPLAKYKGWAPGPVDDWEHGSRGWILWVSMATLLADCLINLGWLVLRPLMRHPLYHSLQQSGPWALPPVNLYSILKNWYDAESLPPLAEESFLLSTGELPHPPDPADSPDDLHSDRLASRRESDSSYAQHKLSSLTNNTLRVLLLFAVILCISGTKYVFGNLVPVYAIVFAVAVSLPFSVMGIRALGETDYNPISGISTCNSLSFWVDSGRQTC
jgi:uncharacterized oligopeptide transporter (OPT) family protein